jgi:hypothetical protein
MESADADHSSQRGKKYSMSAVHIMKCIWTWKAKGREENKVYSVKNSTILFITCQDTTLMYHETFILRIVWRKRDSLSSKLRKMMTGLYWERNKIRKLNIRKSESKRRGRKRRDIKQGSEK